MKPDLTGPMGTASRMDYVAISRATGNKPHAGVCGWLVHAPWAHPIWHSYVIECIHLRPIAGLGPPRIYLPGATHEIYVAAIDPAWPASVKKRPKILHPLNFCGQFIVADDGVAADRIECTVREIISGALNPDTDAIAQWVDRFGDRMLKPGWRKPDSITLQGDKVVVHGTGASALRTLAGDQGNPHSKN